MPLPTPNEIDWRKWSQSYKITTPTLLLTPVEKPDMSPFLVHMTGRNAILSILQGQNSSNQIQGYGYLRASIPEYNQRGYDAKVICFTESPTFALEFFRYRSFRRWVEDQQYGIGFEKSYLVQRGVRPVLYVADEIGRDLIYLYHQIDERQGELAKDGEIDLRLLSILNGVFPLLFPLLLDKDSQGFMWEREWRYPDPNGFQFEHNSIRIICCPANEEIDIRKVLGDAAEQIEFIRAWREYDDITNYLIRQQPVWQANIDRYQEAQNRKEAIPLVGRVIREMNVALNSLEHYQEFSDYLSGEKERIVAEQNNLRERVKEFEDIRKKLIEEQNAEKKDRI